MRTTIVSTSNLKTYRIALIVFDIVILLCLLGFNYDRYRIGERVFESSLPPLIYLMSHMYYPMFLKLRNVSYNDSSIYYNKKGYEVQVPFEDIKAIKLQSVTGIYGIQLYAPSQGEKEIYFKTSLWYPLNFKKKDEMVDELRDKIDAYKKTLPEQNLRNLSSRSI